jgi:hypothetical protein
MNGSGFASVAGFCGAGRSMSSRWKSRSKRDGSAGVSTRVDRSLADCAKLGSLRPNSLFAGAAFPLGDT